MPFLPDWAPNAHPLLLHFPIALLMAAAALDLGGLVTGDRGGWRRAANWLYGVGALAAIATFFSGRAAADSVFLPTAANALLTEHADLGMWTMWFFSGYGIVRSGVALTPVASRFAMRGGMFILGIAGIGLLTITATHGAELVYRHGVGVEAVETRPSESVIKGDGGDRGVARDSLGWLWTPASAAGWKQEADWTEGSGEGLHSSLVDGGDRGDVLELRPSEPTLFVLPGDIDRVQVDLTIDVSDFDGTVLVAHHVQEDGSYGFTSIGNQAIRLGRSENADLLVEATEAFDGSDWRDIRVVVDGTHFRSYVDTRLVVHGQGGTFESGRVGLRLNGTGSVRIARMQVVDLASTAPETD
jgi:uncharacterized membrane protein